MKKKLLSLLLAIMMVVNGLVGATTALAAELSAAQPAAPAAEVTLDLALSQPADGKAFAPGEQVVVTVTLGACDALSAFNFTLGYDDSRLMYQSKSHSNAYQKADIKDTNTKISGEINLSASYTEDQNLPGGSNVLTAVFQVKEGASGSADFALSECAVACALQKVAVNGMHSAFAALRTTPPTGENTAPVRAAGVAAKATASVAIGTAYTLDLSLIFTDAQKDPMTYTVAIGEAAPVAAAAQYSYTPTVAGSTVLVFVAADGMVTSSDCYTVTLAADAMPNDDITVTLGVYDYAAQTADVAHASKDGVVLSAQTVNVPATATAYEAFVQALKAQSPPITYTTSAYGAYFSAINGLAELSEGHPKSGWVFSVNDNFGNLGTAEQTLKNGDRIEMHYSMENYGADVGSYWSPYVPTLTSFTLGGVTKKISYTATPGTYPAPDVLSYQIDDQPMTGKGTATEPFEIPVALRANTDVKALEATVQSTLHAHYQTLSDEITRPTDYTSPVTFAIGTAGGFHQTYYRVTVTTTSNVLPTLQDKVEASVTKSLCVGAAYGVDLATIFADADGDALTYTVAIDGAAAAKTEGNTYAFPTTVPGTKTYVFRANDGKTDSTAAYTVALTVRKPETVTVSFAVSGFDAQKSPLFLVPKQEILVTEGTAERYGQSNASLGTLVGGQEHGVADGRISALDALIAMHEAKYGAAFTKETYQNYLSPGSYLTKIFSQSGAVGFLKNGFAPVGPKSDGYAVNEAVLAEGDVLQFFFYGDQYWGDYVSTIDSNRATVPVGGDLTLTLMGHSAMAAMKGRPGTETTVITPQAIPNAILHTVDVKTGRLTAQDAVTDAQGKVTYHFPQAGQYILTAVGCVSANGSDVPLILSWCAVTVEPVHTVQNAIDAIKAIGTVNINSDSAIAAAQLAFEALSETERAQVSNVDVLTTAVHSYAALKDVSSITVKVGPSTADVRFYHNDGFAADGTDKLGMPALAVDKGVVDQYHQYMLITRRGTIGYRATEGAQTLGGMTFQVPAKVGGGMNGDPISLRRNNLYTSTKLDGTNYPTAAQYTVVVNDAQGKTATNGAPYQDDQTVYPVMLYAGGNTELYTFSYVPLGEYAKNWGVTQMGNRAMVGGTTAQYQSGTLHPLNDYTLTAPAGATVRVFTQMKNFYSPEIPEQSHTENSNGTTSHLFRLSSGAGALSYRVSMPEKITRTDFFAPTAGNTTVTFDAKENPSVRPQYDLSGYPGNVAEDSMLLNISQDNFLTLEQGATFRLRAYRTWQAVSGVVDNIMVEPDFHYNIVSGRDVIAVKPVKSGNGNATGNWLDLEALKPGIAVIEITYDAVRVGNILFGASDPVRKGRAIIRVGGPTETVSWGALASGSDGLWDSELDTVYFYENSGTFQFKPVVSGTIKRVTCNDATLSDKEGVYTAAIRPGNNTLCLETASGAVAYKQIRGAAVTLNVVKTTGDPNSGAFQVGDTVTLSFQGLYAPVPKLAGIYNPGFGNTQKITYFDKNGAKIQGKGAQYTFINDHAITLTITDEMMADGKLTLTGGSIPLTVMGASDMLTGGGHRILTDNGISTNFNACAVSGDFCTLPDIVLKAAGRQTYDITLSGLPDDAEIVLIDGDRKPVAADAGNPLSFKALPYGVYDYEILAPGKKMLRGSFEVSSAAGMGTRTITLTMETIATGAWDGKTITEPVKVTAAESGVTGGDFAGQEGYYKITSGAELSWLAIEPWMMTLNANQRIYARDADYVEKVLQKKTSQHTELVSYFDGEMHYPSLSNTEISSLAKAYEHRTPSVARHAVLANDIDLSEFAWTPIGTESNPYTAVFDGNGKTIRGFYIKSTSACQGLFGEICKATVAHLTLIGSIESSAATVGGVAGKARESTLAAIDCQVEITMTSATTNQRNAVGGLVGDLVNGPSRISNCSFTGSISNGYQQVGGLVGQSMNAKITGCVNRGVINGTQKVGGLVGYDNGSMIQDSFNYGAVEVTGSMGGGLAGYVSGTTISDSANSGTVSANASANSGTVGGLVGIARGASCLTRVENSGVVSATGGQVGGIAGSVQSEDKTTYSILHQVANRGAVTGGGDRVGGVVGYNKGCVVKNGYNNAPVTNTGKGALSTGGIVGMSEYNPWGAASVIVENVYNAGAVNAHNTTAVGAVVGDIVGTQGTAPLKNAYYLVSTAAVAVGDQKEADAISKTPDALKALAPALGSWFKAAADGENDGYPVFETLQRPVVMESYDPDIWLTSYPTVVATLAKECEGILEMQINEGKYAQGSSFTPESDGSYTVSFRAKYGEKFSAETTVRFKVDTAAPTGTICFTQAQNQVSAGVITVMPTDTGSGIASITVTGPEGYSQTKTAAPWEFAVVKAGTYIAKVTDQVNQVSTAISQNVAFVSLTGLTIAKADGETSTATLSNGVLRLTICLNATDTVFALKAVALSPIEQEIHTVTWHSSNDAIASISTTGMVTAHQTGLVTITATAMGTQASLMVKSTKKISGTANDGIATTVNPAAELNSLITNTLPKPESTTLTAAQKMQLAVVTEAVQQMDEHAQQGMSNEALAALDVLLKTASQIQPQCSKQTASGVTLTKKQEIPAAPQAVGLLAAAGVTGTDSNPQTVELSMTQLAPIATAPLSFSLKLMVQGESKQLKAPMIMTVQVPQDYVYSNSHSIRHVKNDGSVEWLSFHFDSAARTISFRVGSFSDFIMMSRPTGGSTSGVGDGDNHDNFWKEVRQAITVAADGIIIKADAAGMNDVPASVIELLTGKNVTLVIATGDKDIVINGLSTPKVEAHRIYFTFAQLTELVKNHVQTSSTAGAAPNLSASNASVVTAKPAAEKEFLNPATGIYEPGIMVSDRMLSPTLSTNPSAPLSDVTPLVPADKAAAQTTGSRINWMLMLSIMMLSGASVGLAVYCSKKHTH